jgi:DNA polymerase IV
MEKAIVHLDLDAFFVSCVRLTDSRLEGLPLIIGGHSDRSVVASCSYEARAFGIRSAMPMKMALRLCPNAKVIKGDMELFARYSDVVTEIIEEKAPVMEKASIDEFYLDVSGMDKFLGCYRWTDELSRKVTRETGLPISFGLSVNKTVSKIGTGEAKPIGKIEIPRGQEKTFLNPLSIKKIPMVGDVTFQLLSRIGIRKIETLSQMPVEMLCKLLGSNGHTLWEKANGIDDTPVVPYTEKKSMSSEQTFEQDTIDIAKIKSILVSMVEKLGFQLRNEAWLTGTVVVKIRYTNFDTHTQQCKIPYSCNDQVLIRTVNQLFDKLYQKRMRIRLVGIRFTHLVHGAHQMSLFEDTHEMIALDQAMDKMKKKYGSDVLQRCIGLSPTKK